MLTSRRRKSGLTARTIRFPSKLRDRIVTDAERCGRSFEAQVIAVLRRHYGEDVDIRPAGKRLLALVQSSLAGVPESEIPELTKRLRSGE